MNRGGEGKEWQGKTGLGVEAERSCVRTSECEHAVSAEW